LGSKSGLINRTGRNVCHDFGFRIELQNRLMRFSDAPNGGREGVENMEYAMLPSLRIGNTFTSLTEKFWA